MKRTILKETAMAVAVLILAGVHTTAGAQGVREAGVQSGDRGAEIVIDAHVKKASYLLSPRTAETPFTVSIIVNGDQFTEALKGVEEATSETDAEDGRGIRYEINKRVLVKPGVHKIVFITEDGRRSEVEAVFEGGKSYSVRFDPTYGPKRQGLKKTFYQGVTSYKGSVTQKGGY